MRIHNPQSILLHADRSYLLSDFAFPKRGQQLHHITLPKPSKQLHPFLALPLPSRQSCCFRADHAAQNFVGSFNVSLNAFLVSLFIVVLVLVVRVPASVTVVLVLGRDDDDWFVLAPPVAASAFAVTCTSRPTGKDKESSAASLFDSNRDWSSSLLLVLIRSIFCDCSDGSLSNFGWVALVVAGQYPGHQ